MRTTAEGVLYRMRVGCLWRDLPKEFGSRSSSIPGLLQKSGSRCFRN
ncbi:MULTISPECIES: transposase [Pseudomonas]|nr:transposase [Pseudomonas savastanoi pv. savastanoi]UKL10067.1 transposase [Pseudomonas savastanoi pv. savastanoi]